MQAVINNVDAVIAEPSARALLQQMVAACPELLSSSIEAAFKSRFLPPPHAAAAQAALLEACGASPPSTLRHRTAGPPWPQRPLRCAATPALSTRGPTRTTGSCSAGSAPAQRISTGGEVIDADLSLLQSFAASPPDGGMPGWPHAPPSLALPPLPEEPLGAAGGPGRAGDGVGESLRPTAGTLAVAMPGRADRPGMEPDALRRQAHASMHASEDTAMPSAPRCGFLSCLALVGLKLPESMACRAAVRRVCQRACRAFKTQEDEQTERLAVKLGGHVRKRLQQIRRLEVQAAAGAALDAQQRSKMLQRGGYEAARVALDRGDDAACASPFPTHTTLPGTLSVCSLCTTSTAA